MGFWAGAQRHKDLEWLPSIAHFRCQEAPGYRALGGFSSQAVVLRPLVLLFAVTIHPVQFPWECFCGETAARGTIEPILAVDCRWKRHHRIRS